jgi:hypothetical protein
VISIEKVPSFLNMSDYLAGSRGGPNTDMGADSGRDGHHRVETGRDQSGCHCGKLTTKLKQTKILLETVFCTCLIQFFFAPSVQVKIPITEIGLQAASQLAKSGIRVTMTGVYSVHQVAMEACSRFMLVNDLC